MRGLLIFVCFLLVGVIDVHGFAPPRTPQKNISRCRARTTHFPSSLGISRTTPNPGEYEIRNLLDEAVMLHHVTMMERLPSQEDAERLICDISKALYSSSLDEPSTQDPILKEVSHQLDKAVMQACQQPDLPSSIETVEALAFQYHEVRQMTMTGPTLELETRLQDLQQLVNVHQAIPVLHESVVMPEPTVLEKQSLQECASVAFDESSTSAPADLILEDMSHQLDEAVMAACQQPNATSPIERVEALAFQYHEVRQMTTTDPTVELETRLLDLRQLLKDHQANPALRENTAMSEPILSTIQPVQDPASVVSTMHGASRRSITVDSNGNQQLSTPSPTQVRVSPQFVSPRVAPARHATSLFASMRADIELDESELDTTNDDETDEVDIAIVGAGIGGLTAGAILNTLYNKRVGIYESHYLAGGCAHAFDRRASNGVDFTFDSGPTIVLGCSTPPYNPLRQVLNAIGQEVKWIPYQAWGMIENPARENEKRWRLELGPEAFEQGPLREFGGVEAQQEFRQLRELTKGLVSGAVEIPAMAMRPGNSALIPLFRYLPALVGLLQQGDLSTGTFSPYMDGPIFKVENPWFRSWLDALAFSLSGLPASRTSAAAMAYVLFDMHRSGAALDYPVGGLGSVIDALVRGVEQGSNGSKVHLRRHVESIDTTEDGSRITGLTLRGGKRVKARQGVICNAPVWCLSDLVKNEQARSILDNFLPSHAKSEPRQSWKLNEMTNSYELTDRESFEPEDSLLFKTETAEQTGSFLHLHLAIKDDGLDLSKMEAHYTVMDRSLEGDGPSDGPCGELNMIAVSNPCVLDKTLAPDGYMVLHAYGAGNEPYELWKDVKRNSPEYKELKEERAQVLWRAVESIIPDVRDRVVLELVGSPKTHERFLRRPNGTYGAATEDYLKDGGTSIDSLVLAGDGIFPGIGVPAVALTGASAANGFVGPLEQWQCLDALKREQLI